MNDLLPSLMVFGLCCGWPMLWAMAAYSVGKHGLRGALFRLIPKRYLIETKSLR